MVRADEVKRIVPMVLSLVKEPDAAKEKADRARQLVQRLQADMVGRVRKELG